MLELLQNFEQAAARFSPVILIAPGLAVLLLGLFVWLGGLGFKRHLLAVAGALGGGICGSLVLGRNILSAVALAVIAAVIAMIFERLFTTILALVLAVSIAFAVLARPYMAQPPSDPATKPAGTTTAPLSASQSLVLIKSYAVDLGDKVKQLASQMPILRWAVILVVAVAAVVAAFTLRRLAAAWSYATFGTILVYTGMILLLFYKASAPISAVFRKPPFYAIVFAAMVAFGTIVQLILCKQKKPKSTKTKQSGKHGEQSRPEKQSWRTG